MNVLILSQKRVCMGFCVFIGLLTASPLFADFDHARTLDASQPPPPPPAVTDTLIISRTTTANNIGLTFYNNGFFGTNLSTRNPSMEFPMGSTQEHLVRAGPWIGGIKELVNEPGAYDTLVTTAATDGYYGSFSAEHVSEFYPASSEIIERSVLVNSEYFDPTAKSEQDFLISYIDRHTHGSEFHKPLNIKIDQEILQYSIEPFDAIIQVSFTIRNVDPIAPIYDMYMGFYAEMASGWKDGHSAWPPSSWFGRKDIAFVDSLRLATEHHYTLDDGDCPAWGGFTFLNVVPGGFEERTFSFNWWDWDPTGRLPGTPHTDTKKYLFLSNGASDSTNAVEVPNHDPQLLISVGPLGLSAGEWPGGGGRFVMNPGDSATITMAFVGGQPVPSAPRTAEEDIAYHALMAQHYLSPDHTPPELTLDIFQNPDLTHYLDIYLAGSEPLETESVSIIIDGAPLAVECLDPIRNLWMADYELEAPSDSAVIEACASDIYANENCVGLVFSASQLTAIRGGAAFSPDRSVALNIPPGQLSQDAYILIQQPDSGEVTIGPDGILGSGTATLKFEYTERVLPAGVDARHLYIERVGSGALECFVDSGARTICAQIHQCGTFRLAVSDGYPSRRSDPSYLMARPNFPNPFEMSTTIPFDLRAEQSVRVTIFDVSGREVARPFEGMIGPGEQRVVWNGVATDGRRVMSGSYFYRLEAGRRTSVGKLLLMR
ncbi:MAG: hypothetical protein KJ970_13615 [Candidatus Eisenbacteria bacterium]|uniref:T9SS type A sorting domain-containing protein n=1 Tax=Eiseniibacteriota bacterium TaxID=2212470 RepID=A0A948RYJ3_UNCEI|nr:hypothetical protein [Candidatus Eisenbacteria bacterium]MBU1950357.1 hypothetical protein [Candidatus Eisenbacteria bacterium]MBU2691952.1 hypothetical protein [Candidatus Eisenbacteria bacterium]